jgi:rRNA maturation endonuclease Nob1
MKQAEAPLKKKLAIERAKAKTKPKGDKIKVNSWQKTCPKCMTRVPAQQHVCACGHNFSGK